MLNPPSPFKSSAIDIRTELNNLLKADFESGLDFHENVSVTIAKMKDAHTFYQFPCSSYFYYVFPYQFYVVEIEGKQTLIGYEHPLTGLTDVYLQISDSADLKQKIITHIKTDDIEDIPNEDPIETIRRWADKYEPFSRVSAVRLNHALSESFTARTVFNYPRPNPLTITFISNTEDNSTQDAIIPYYVFSIANFTSVEKMCPLTSNNAHTQNQLHSSEHTSTSSHAASKPYHTHHTSRSLVNNTLYSDVHKAFISQPTFPLTLSSASSLLRPPVSPLSVLHHHLHMRPISLSPKLQALAASHRNVASNTDHQNTQVHTSTSHTSPSSSSPPSSSSLSALTAKQKRLAVVAGLENEEDDDGLSIPAKVFHNSVNQMEVPDVFPTTSSKFCSGVINLTSNVAYLHIHSFNAIQQSDMEAFFGDIMSHVTNAFMQGARLVIDVRQNDGGNVALAMWLTTYLFPHHFPRQPPFTVVANKVAETFIDTNLAQTKLKLIDPYTQEVIPSFSRIPKQNITRSTSPDQPFKATATREFTKPFSFTYDQMTQQISTVHGFEFFRQTLFPAGDIVVITDGQCGSACGQFLKPLKEKNLVTVVGVGLPRTENSPDNGTFDIASFTAGNVIDSSIFHIPATSTLLHTFPRNSTVLSFTLSATHSVDWEHTDELLEFKVVQPDLIIPHLIAPDEWQVDTRFNLINRILNELDNVYGCLEWQTQPDAFCSVGRNVSDHKIMGRPCVRRSSSQHRLSSSSPSSSPSSLHSHNKFRLPRTPVVPFNSSSHKLQRFNDDSIPSPSSSSSPQHTQNEFSDTECVFSKCEDGFYLDHNGDCQVIPLAVFSRCLFTQHWIYDAPYVSACLRSLPVCFFFFFLL